MIPTPGRIVEYTLNELDADRINRDRQAGTRLATGNQVHEGQSYPMLIIVVADSRTWVHGQVFLDGNDTYWATGLSQNEDANDLRGTWREYPRV